MKDDVVLTIGQIAKQAGIRTSKIRYYESIGLLKTPARASGRRVYGADILTTLRLIQFAQDAGFAIPEIHHVLEGFDRTTPASSRWHAVAARKLAEVRRLIGRARQMEALLGRLLACECVRLGDCVSSCGAPSTGTQLVSRPRAACVARLTPGAGDG